MAKFDVKTFLAVPGTPTVTPQGATGATSYSYKVVAVDADGNRTTPSTAGSTATGNATLNGSNFNRVSWSAVPAATKYEVYRSASGGTPSSTGKIGEATASPFDDTGLAAAGAEPTTNDTGFSPALDVSHWLGNKTIQVSGTFTATLQPQGRVDPGADWIDEGSAITAAGTADVTKRFRELRVRMTAYTSGTPRAYVNGG